MGYSKTLVVGDNFAYGGNFPASATYGISTVAGNIDFGNYTTPVFGGTIKAVYMDLEIGWIYNSNAGANWLDGNQYIRASKGGSTAGIYIKDASLWTQGSGYRSGFTYYGQTDVKDRFVQGELTNVYWASAKSKLDTLNVNDMQIRFRFIIE